MLLHWKSIKFLPRIVVLNMWKLASNIFFGFDPPTTNTLRDSTIDKTAKTVIANGEVKREISLHNDNIKKGL